MSGQNTIEIPLPEGMSASEEDLDLLKADAAGSGSGLT